MPWSDQKLFYYSVDSRSQKVSTSLKSFHLYLTRFIPGTAANAVNFQAYMYIIDGIVHCNTSRASGLIQGAEGPLRTFNVCMKQKV